MMRLDKKVAVITAGASGMGKAGALRFAQEGAIVHIVDINEEAGIEVKEEIERNGGESYFYKVDLSSVRQIESRAE